MEREGEGRREEKRRGRRGIVIGGMVIGLLMGCNNGLAELEKEKESILSISNLRQGFLDIFATFGDMVSGAFGITKDTTKQEVGVQLGKVGEAVGAVKDKLEGIKGSEQYNSIKDKADNIIAKALETLGKIVEGTSKIKEATKSASGKIGGNASGDSETAAPAESTSIKNLIAGIHMICEAAEGVKIDLKGKADKQIVDSAKIATLFNQTGQANDDKALKGANRAVNTASGADILAAIREVKDTNKEAGNIQNAANAYDIAVANKSNGDLTTIKTNASAIAAGLALRAMAKDGKLATSASNAPGEAVNSVLIGVVDKTVNEIISIIRRTVDKCLKDVNDCIREGSNSEVKSK